MFDGFLWFWVPQLSCPDGFRWLSTIGQTMQCDGASFQSALKLSDCGPCFNLFKQRGVSIFSLSNRKIANVAPVHLFCKLGGEALHISAMGGVKFMCPAFFRKTSLSLSYFFRFASFSSCKTRKKSKFSYFTLQLQFLGPYECLSYKPIKYPSVYRKKNETYCYCQNCQRNHLTKLNIVCDCFQTQISPLCEQIYMLR